MVILPSSFTGRTSGVTRVCVHLDRLQSSHAHPSCLRVMSCSKWGLLLILVCQMQKSTWDKATDMEQQSAWCWAKGLSFVQWDAEQAHLWLFPEFVCIGDGWSLVHREQQQLRAFQRSWLACCLQLSQQDLTLQAYSSEIGYSESSYLPSTPKSHHVRGTLNFSLNLNYSHSNIEHFLSNNMRTSN